VDGELPHIDERAVAVDAPADVVWAALTVYVDRALVRARRAAALRRVLGTEPASGFAVVAVEAGRAITLGGRHRFSRYRLTFSVTPAADGGTELRARTDAAFPGPHGSVYRALVIGTRLHVVVTTRMLRAIRDRSLIHTRP
jgi:hypothetical protein